MKKIILCIVFMAFLSINIVASDIYIDDCSSLSKSIEKTDIGVNALDSDLSPYFYDDTHILQRNSDGEHYVIYKIPYLKKATITTYFWPEEDISDFIFSLSNSETDFEETLTLSTDKSESGKWKRIIYTFENIKPDYCYLKITWPEKGSSWAQGVGEIKATLSKPVAFGAKINSSPYIVIPPVGAEPTVIKLHGMVLDQAGFPMTGFPEVWEMNISTEGVSLSPDGVLTVLSEAEPDTSIRIRFVSGDLVAEKEIILTPNKLGDLNRDNKIDKADLEIAASLYRTNSPDADINGDGIVDIIDIAYIAKNIAEEEDVSEDN